MRNLETAARFGSAYVPGTADDVLTVRGVLHDSFGVFALAVFLAGVAAIVSLAYLAA